MIEAIWIDENRYKIANEDYGFELCQITISEGLDKLTDEQKTELANEIKKLAVSFATKYLSEAN